MRILIVYNTNVVNSTNLNGTTGQFGGINNPMEVVPDIGSIIEYKKVVDSELYEKGLGGVEVTTYIVGSVQYVVDEEESETVCLVQVKDEMDSLKGLGRKVYRHYKGYLYEKLGETITEEEAFKNVSKDSKAKVRTVPVRHHEEGNVNIGVIYRDGEMLYISDEPFVIYKSMQGIKKGTVWAREVDDFYRIENIDGYKRKRFTQV